MTEDTKKEETTTTTAAAPAVEEKKAEQPKKQQPKKQQPKKGQQAKKQQPKKEQPAKKDDDDGPPPLEGATPESAEGEEEESKKIKQSRSEKKSRKAVQKLGMKPVPGIVRVTVKRAKNILFVISRPDVFKSPASDTYIIFGEAKIEDTAAASLKDKAKKVLDLETPAAAAAAATEAAEKPAAKEPTKKVEEVTESELVDETGIEAKDIDLVMGQTNVSRAQAVKALKKHNGDIVNAIMELTM